MIKYPRTCQNKETSKDLGYIKKAKIKNIGNALIQAIVLTLSLWKWIKHNYQATRFSRLMKYNHKASKIEENLKSDNYIITK